MTFELYEWYVPDMIHGEALHWVNRCCHLRTLDSCETFWHCNDILQWSGKSCFAWTGFSLSMSSMASVEPLQVQQQASTTDFVSKLPLSVTHSIFLHCSHKDIFVFKAVSSRWKQTLTSLPGGPWRNVTLRTVRDLAYFRDLLRANATNMTNWIRLENLIIKPYPKDSDNVSGDCELLTKEVLQLLTLIKCNSVVSVG